MKQNNGTYLSFFINSYGMITPKDETTKQYLDTHTNETLHVIVPKGQKGQDWLAVNAKFFQLIKIFSDNMPESLEKRFSIEGVNGKGRTDSIRFLLFDALNLYSTVRRVNIRGEERIESTIISISDLSFEEYVKIYPQVRDLIFSLLFNEGWGELQMKNVFGVLYSK